MKIFKPSSSMLAIVAAGSVLALSGCDDSTTSPGVTPLNIDIPAATGTPLASIREGQFNIDVDLASVAFKSDAGSAQLDFSVGFGSGAFHHNDDPANVFYTITDRGPNIKCKDSDDILGIDDFCGADNGGNKIFPTPTFTPSIVKFQITDNNGDLGFNILEVLPLLDENGDRISGITNPLTVTDTEVSFSNTGEQLDFDAEGLDTEALVKLNDGSFWLSDEYGPSMIHVSAEGRIIERVVPAGMESDLADAEYPVNDASPALPTIFKKRKLNRGMESIAVTADNSYMYFIMQSPLANPDGGAYAASRQVRLMKMSLAADGSIASYDAEYVYVMDAPMTFANKGEALGDLKNGDYRAQKDVKISEMVAIDEDRLIVLERISGVTKLYSVNLDGAENILNTNYDLFGLSSGSSQSLEQTRHKVTPVIKQLVFNSMDYDFPAGVTGLPKKVEGIAMLDASHVLLINDNDFGIEGDATKAVILDIASALNSTHPQRVELDADELDTYNSGLFGESAAEIVSYDEQNNQLYVVNSSAATVDVLDVFDGSDLDLDHDSSIDLSSAELKFNMDNMASLSIGAANSVAVHNGMVAVAVENSNKQENGIVAFYNSSDLNSAVAACEVGALPDMVTFTPNGNYVLVANEGEPNDDYDVDPEGSVSIINISGGVNCNSVSIASFVAFNDGQPRHSELPDDVRIFGAGASVAQDLEPEYIAVSGDSSRAFVSLQENNALAIIDISTANVVSIAALGFKDFSAAENALDVSNKDKTIQLNTWDNLYGMYQPDSIAAFSYKGDTFVVSANEGDSRDYDGFSEEERVKDVTLAPDVFASDVADSDQLGRLKITTTLGNTDLDGDLEELYAYGARSFSIWDDQGRMIFDSGNDMERIVLDVLGEQAFNSNHTETKADSRSDDKGPEPEGLAVANINGRQYAFIGLERVGGIMVYDITNPYGVQFIQYLNNRNFTQAPCLEPEDGDLDGSCDPDDVSSPEHNAFALDLGPEGLTVFNRFGRFYLAVGNEVSGTTTVYELAIVGEQPL